MFEENGLGEREVVYMGVSYGEKTIAWQEHMRADVAQHRPDWSPHFKAPKNVYLRVSPGEEERARLTSGSSQSFNPFRALPRNRFAALVLRVDKR